MEKKEMYEKPEIKTEELEVNVFGTYGGDGGGPIPALMPFFGLCCN